MHLAQSTTPPPRTHKTQWPGRTEHGCRKVHTAHKNFLHRALPESAVRRIAVTNPTQTARHMRHTSPHCAASSHTYRTQDRMTKKKRCRKISPENSGVCAPLRTKKHFGKYRQNLPIAFPLPFPSARSQWRLHSRVRLQTPMTAVGSALCGRQHLQLPYTNFRKTSQHCVRGGGARSVIPGVTFVARHCDSGGRSSRRFCQ